MVIEVDKKVTRLLLAEADDTDMITKDKDIKGFIPNLAVGQMTVSHVSGLFKEDTEARREFYKLIDMQ